MTSDVYPPLTGQAPTPGAGARLVSPASSASEKTPVHPQAPGSPDTAAPATPHDQHPSIEVADWDILFDAIETRLRQTVGERLGAMPETPAHSAQLAASLVQATVLDCVDALHKLHAAIKHDRSQRPTP